jgi:tRNA A37 threonylcarbamoyladenosine synthetase subunit TsaC/SUA5/YrdC
MEMLEKKVNEGNSAVVHIKNKLPETYVLHSAEITSNPHHFTNQHLKNYLGAEFDIVLDATQP